MNYKKILTGIVAVAAVAMVMTACSEEVEVNNNSNTNASFKIGVSVHQGWDDPQPTRAARFEAQALKMQAAGAKDVIAFNETFEGKPIYLHCDAIDGFNGKGHSVEIDNAAEATRGTLMNGHDGSTGQGMEHFVKSTFYDNFNIYPGVGMAEHISGTANEWKEIRPITWQDVNYGVAPANANGVVATDNGFTFTTAVDSDDQIDLMSGPSEKINGTIREQILFKFQHVLSAVRFKLGNDFSKGYIIKKISLTNVNCTNTYTFGTGWGASPSNPQIVYADGLSFETTNGAGLRIIDDGDPTTGEPGETFILLPQTLTSGSYAVVSLCDEDDDSETLTFYASLQGQTWEPGYAYTYTISNTPYKNEFTFDVEVDPTFDFVGNASSSTTSAFKVTSYRKEGPTKTPEAVAWDVAGYEVSNNGTTWTTVGSKPEWLEVMTESGPGDTGSGIDYAPGVESQTAAGTVGQRRQNILRNLEEKGSATAPLDLSMYKVDNTTAWAGRTTANCYIVRAPGYYKIPLVIGNTIKNGSINAPETYSVADETFNFKVTQTKKGDVVDGEQRYKFDFQISGTYVTGKQTFVDYNNALVTATNYKVNASTAEVLWHDFQHTEKGTELAVIKDVAISTTGADALVDKFVTFYVDKETIQQGNAVIAVKDASGTIMWSWQIYVTDRNWNTEVTTIENPAFHYGPNNSYGADIPAANFTISNYNLGYVEMAKKGTSFTYPARYIRVTFRQPESGTTVQRIITQLETTVNVPQEFHWDTKYQWGRKDALPGNDTGSEGSPASYSPFYCKYYPWGSYVRRYNVIENSTQGSTYGYSIKNPLVRLHTESEYMSLWTKKFYVNAWDAQQRQAVTSQKSNSGDRTPEGLAFPHVVISNVTKTIYDPCPAGFKMPPSGAFTRFTYSGSNQGGDNRNISGDFNYGYNFYTTGWQTGPTVFFPATGRLQDGGLRQYNLQSWVWSATAEIPTDNYFGENHKSTQKPGNYTGTACSRHLSFSYKSGDPDNSIVNTTVANVVLMPHSVRPMVDND